jgi:hypothetical protein
MLPKDTLQGVVDNHLFLAICWAISPTKAFPPTAWIRWITCPFNEKIGCAGFIEWEFLSILPFPLTFLILPVFYKICHRISIVGQFLTSLFTYLTKYPCNISYLDELLRGMIYAN